MDSSNESCPNTTAAYLSPTLIPNETVDPRSCNDLPQIPGFQVLSEIGRGGMGKVYRATDVTLRREVAVKVMLSDRRVEAFIRRFEEETLITGQLQHPGVPPVYAMGTLADGVPFMAMKLIEGHTLGTLLGQRASPAENLSRWLEVFENICQTVGYAHDKRIIHRDLKPQNIMVGRFAEVQVMDWGMAKPVTDGPGVGATDQIQPAVSMTPLGLESTSAHHTREGSVLGTLAYMPPEQARGEIYRHHFTSDVFALGCILFEILTGGLVYTGSQSEVHAKAASGQLEDAFARLDAAEVDAGLKAITRTCLALEQNQRFLNGREVALAIARFRANAEQRLRELEADRVAQTARAVEQRKRRRVQFGFAAALVALAGTIGGSLWIADHRESVRRQETLELQKSAIRELKQEQAKTAHQLTRAEWTIYGNLLEKAQRDHESFSLATARDLLDTCRWDLRGWEHQFLQSRFTVHRTPLKAHHGKIFRVAYSSDGRWVATGSEDKSVALWDARTHAKRNVIYGFEWALLGLTFAKHDALLISGTERGELKAHEPQTGRLICDLRSQEKISEGALHVTCGADGNGEFFVSANAVGLVDIYESRSLRRSRSIKAHDGVICRVILSEDGRRIATGGADGFVKVWDRASGNLLQTFQAHADPIFGLAFAPDEKRLASGSVDGLVKVYDLISKKEIFVGRGHQGHVHAVLWTGVDTLISAGDDKVLHLWNVSAKAKVGALTGHTNTVFNLALRPDGNQLASVDGDGTLILWDMAALTDPNIWQGFKHKVNAVAFHPDENWVAAGALGGQLQVFPCDGKQDPIVLNGHKNHIFGVAFSRDGQRLVSHGLHELCVWDWRNATCLAWVDVSKNAVDSFAYRESDGQIAIGHLNGSIEFFQAPLLESMGTKAVHASGVSALAYSRDGALLASGGHDGVVQIVDARTHAPVKRITCSYPIRSLSFHPSGSELAIASTDDNFTRGEVKVVRVDGDGESVLSNKAQAPIHRISYLHDGTRLAGAATHDPGLRVWETTNGYELVTLKFPVRSIGCFVSSSRGRFLALGEEDPRHTGYPGRTLIYGLPASTRSYSLQTQSDRATAAHIDRNEKEILGATENGTVVVWDANSGAELRRSDSTGKEITCLETNRSGTLLAAGQVDGTLRLWDYPALTELKSHRPLTARVQAIRLLQDPRQCIVAGHGGKAILVDPRSGELLRTLVEVPAANTGIALSPDETMVFSAWENGVVRGTQVATGETVCSLAAAKGTVSGIACHPVEPWIAYGINQPDSLKRGRIHVYNYATKHELIAMDAHDGPIWCLRFSHDGKRLVSWGGDNCVNAWAAPSWHKVASIRCPGYYPAELAIGEKTGRVLAPGMRTVFGKTRGEILVWDGLCVRGVKE